MTAIDLASLPAPDIRRAASEDARRLLRLLRARVPELDAYALGLSRCSQATFVDALAQVLAALASSVAERRAEGRCDTTSDFYDENVIARMPAQG